MVTVAHTTVYKSAVVEIYISKELLILSRIMIIFVIRDFINVNFVIVEQMNFFINKTIGTKNSQKGVD
jgi:hypothetical protein